MKQQQPLCRPLLFSPDKAYYYRLSGIPVKYSFVRSLSLLPPFIRIRRRFLSHAERHVVVWLRNAY